MKYWQVSIAAVVLGILAIGSSNSFAASDPIYMNFQGIQGDTTEKAFEHQIQLNSFQFGVVRPISSPSGGIRESGAPSLSEITITKFMDKASPQLFQSSLVGQAVSPVTISFAKVTGLGLVTYAEYTLDNVLISGYSVSSGGDTPPSESLSLSFTKITFKFTPTNPDGSPSTTPISTTYDLVTGRAG